MDAVTWNYVERAGAPPDGEPWFYLGYDANRQPHIMRWYSNTDTGEAYWLAISLQDHPTRNCEPVVHAIRGENVGMIVRWAMLPARLSDLAKDDGPSEARSDGDQR